MKVFGISIFFSLLFSAVLNAQTLDEILKKHFEAVNQEKLSQVQTAIIKGKINQAGMEIPFAMYQKRPQKLRTEGTFQGMTVLQVFDGDKGWSVNPFMGSTEPQPTPPDQLDQIKDQADIDGYFYNHEKKGYKLELMPEEEIEGARMYVIQLTKPNKDVITSYLDAENFVIIKTKSKMKVQGVDTEIESYLSNYKPIEEIMYPFSIENKMNGQTMMQLSIDSVEFNKEIEDTLFTIQEKK